MSDAIVTNRLTKHFGGKRVVDSLSLRVPAGSVYGLLGRNGAGKSTAIKMLMGMVRPDSGSATLWAKTLPRSPQRLGSGSRISAEGHPLYGWMTVGRAVRIHAFVLPTLERRAGRPDSRPLRAVARTKSTAACRAASRPRYRWRWPWRPIPSCSCSTIRRWAGHGRAADFLESLIQIIQRQGRTILFSSHILGDVERVADRIGIMDRRRAARRLPHGNVPRIGPQDGAGVRGTSARIAATFPAW